MTIGVSPDEKISPPRMETFILFLSSVLIPVLFSTQELGLINQNICSIREG